VSQWRNAFTQSHCMPIDGFGLAGMAWQSIGCGRFASWKVVLPQRTNGTHMLHCTAPAQLTERARGRSSSACRPKVCQRRFNASTVGLIALAGPALRVSRRTRRQCTTQLLAIERKSMPRKILCSGAVLMLIALILGEQFFKATAAWGYASVAMLGGV
jgi:hypothetical protein